MCGSVDPNMYYVPRVIQSHSAVHFRAQKVTKSIMANCEINASGYITGD